MDDRARLSPSAAKRRRLIIATPASDTREDRAAETTAQVIFSKFSSSASGMKRVRDAYM
jgi:hypothetical protein